MEQSNKLNIKGLEPTKSTTGITNSMDTFVSRLYMLMIGFFILSKHSVDTVFLGCSSWGNPLHDWLCVGFKALLLKSIFGHYLLTLGSGRKDPWTQLPCT